MSRNHPSAAGESLQQTGELERGLKDRHIQLIALGGAIGVGLFLGSAKAIHKAGPLLLFEADAAEGGVDLVLGMLPHAAGVVEDGVGLGRGAGQFPALPAQRGDDELTVEHVHLAADRFNPEPFRHGPQCIQPPIAAPGWKRFAGIGEGTFPTAESVRGWPGPESRRC